MPTAFTLLNEIRQQPEMYVGGDSRDRTAQLRNLEILLNGYSLAVEMHGLDDPGRGFVRSFAAYLHRRFGWPIGLGPIVAILDGVRPGEDPWRRFWTLIDDFREHLSDGAALNC